VSILTFGYGNRSNYDEFAGLVSESGVTHVVDVRMRPKGWARIWYADQIAAKCRNLGVDYLSIPALGNTSGTSDWVPPNEEEATDALHRVSSLLESGTVMLICAEMDAHRCHRTAVALRLQELTQGSISHVGCKHQLPEKYSV
jgi:uncharacterized protein (DUF488 family)